MKELMTVDVTRAGLWMDANVTFAQVDNWYGHVTRDLKMDIIYPFEHQQESWPCIVWICGGGWMQLDRHAHIPNLMELARERFVLVSVDYRDSNYATFPAQLEDVKSAIRYIKAHAKRYQIDPERIGVMGESAGGHLAGMVGVTSHTDEFDVGNYLEFDSSVKAVCPWYMPADFSQMMRTEEGISTGMLPESRLLGVDVSMRPEIVERANPISYVTQEAPPFLLIHGTDDRVVPYYQSELMYDALTKVGVEAELIGIEGGDHADIYFFQPQVMSRIIDFFNTHLKE